MFSRIQRIVVLASLLAFISCAGNNHVQTVQITHDSLALAQDLEARICWGVSSVFEGPADKSHCTAPLAVTVQLTDARHQAINGRLAQAFTVHRSVTAQLAAGATNVDFTTLTNLITAILTDLATLKQTPEVVQLVHAVEAGKVVR